MRGQWKKPAKILWNKHKLQHPHPTSASLISQFLLMWLILKMYLGDYMTHMLRTWLYIYRNRDLSNLYTAHSKASTLESASGSLVLPSLWELKAGVWIFRDNILQPSFKSCQERTDASPLPPTPVTSVGPLQHVSFPLSVWRWQFAFTQCAGSNAGFLSCQKRRMVDITGLTSVCLHLLWTYDLNFTF